MASEDEYVYRLGVDYKDMDRALNAVLNLIGRVDEEFAQLPAEVKRAMRGSSKAVADFQNQLSKSAGKITLDVDDKRAIAAERRQKKELDQLAEKLRTASAEYGRFQQNAARGLQRPGGLQPTRQTNAQLADARQTGAALAANNRPLSGQDRAYLAAVKAEQTARAAVAAKKASDRAAEKAAQAKATAQEIADAEKAAAAQVRAEAKATEAARKALAAQVKADDAAYRSGLASANKRVQAKARGAAKEIKAADDVAKAQAAADRNAASDQQDRRYAGSNVPNRIQAVRTYESAGISPTYRPLEFSTGRNTAAANGGSAEATEGAQRNYLAGLKRQAEADERVNAAQKRFGDTLRDQYQRELPRFRYALYDVSNATRVGGLALIAFGSASIATAVQYQDLYASVKRTSDILTSGLSVNAQNQQYAQLRQNLVDLTKQLPVTFEEVTKIATLGNQLGISSVNIAAFTTTVAKFSATTGVSVDESATAFGRLGELLDNTDYKKIGDEIAYLGVKAVATESEIIDTTTQLAVSLQSLNTLPRGTAESQRQIQQTTQATLALSTTVASLGVKPEQARGTFIRAFSSIGAAVADGGTKLNDFGRISGLGSAEFRKQWEAGGTSAYTAFLKFTQGLGSNTAEINGNLDSIGIKAVRDRQTLGLLAQNGTRAFADLANASKGSKNNFLDTSYRVQTETVAKQLQVLGQQVLAVFDQIGSQAIGPITDLLGFLRKVVGALDDISHNPVTAYIAAALTVIVLFAGGLGIAASVAGRFAANMIALQQVIADTTANGGFFVGMLSAMTGSMVVTEKQVNELTASLIAEGLAQDEANLAARRSLGVPLSGPIGKNSAAVSKLTTAVKGLAGIGALLGLALILPVVGDAIKDWILDLKGAVPEVDALATAVENLNTKGADQAQGTITKGFQAFGTQEKGEGAGYHYENQIIGNGITNRVLVRNDAKVKTITAGAAAVNQQVYGQQTLKGQTLSQGADVDTATKELQNADAAIAKLYAGGNTKGADELLRQLQASMGKAGVKASVLEQALTKTKAALGATGEATIADAKANRDAATSAQDASDATDAYKSSLDDIFGGAAAAKALSDALHDLGAEAKDAGAATALNGDKMRAVIEAIYESTDDQGVAKGRLQAIYDQLVKLGYTIPELVGLQQAIDSLTGDAVPATADLSAFTDGLNGVGDAADETTAKVRTLADYASDLGSVFSRAFDLRFGDQQGLDAVTKGFIDAKAAIADTRAELKKAKADLASAVSDRDTTERQLAIAQKYGDNEAVARLSARLGENNADIAEKRKGVRDARTANDRTLTGNGEAAINNRAQLLPLIQNGQQYLQSLAGNGATQKQLEDAAARLKKQFVEQAVQMGYSKKDADKLAGAYDDMKQVIQEVPKDVTTTFDSNVSAAQQAVNEYLATLTGADGTKTTQTVETVQVFTDQDGNPVSADDPRLFADDQRSGPTSRYGLAGEKAAIAQATSTGTADDQRAPQTAKTLATQEQKRLQQVLSNPAAIYPKQWESFKRIFGFEGKKPTGSFIAPWITLLKANNQKVPRGYRDGGYTGNLAPWQVAGQVHGREYVLNERATKMFPRQMLDAANHGVQPVVTNVNATATLGGDRTMSLGRIERQLLASAAGGGQLTVRADRIGSALDQAFTASDRRGAA